jgi:hypothetical protein
VFAGRRSGSPAPNRLNREVREEFSSLADRKLKITDDSAFGALAVFAFSRMKLRLAVFFFVVHDLRVVPS